MRAKWVLAKMRAERMTPRYGLMIPFSVPQLQRTEEQFCARTLREARLDV